jgi:hypothetical protein
MLNTKIEELLIEEGASQCLIWEVRYLIEGPPTDYIRINRPSLSLYLFKDNPRYMYFVPLLDPAYKGMVIRALVTDLINEIPSHLIDNPDLLPLLNKGLRELKLPEGFVYHNCCSLKLIDTLYLGGPELYAGWNGNEYITFVTTTTWEMKRLHLDTLISLRDYLPKDVNELLLNLIQCRLPLSPPMFNHEET